MSARKGWDARASEAILRLAVEHDRFTTDDVWLAPEMNDVPVTGDRRFMGPVMADARRSGIIEMTIWFEPSIIPACHMRPKRVWRSTIYGDRSRLPIST